MKRRIAIILLLLFLGAVVNVAVAWGCAFLANAVGSAASATSDDVNLLRRWIPDQPPPCSVIAGTTPGYAYRKLIGEAKDDFGEVLLAAPHIPITTSDTVVRAGWPRASFLGICSQRASVAAQLRHHRQSASPFLPEAPTEAIRGIMLHRPATFGEEIRFLPLHPIWPGFIINTVFFALILWLLFAAPFAARRMIRRRRGLCEQCAYPIGTWGGSPVCTECGAAVSRKVEA